MYFYTKIEQSLYMICLQGSFDGDESVELDTASTPEEAQAKINYLNGGTGQPFPQNKVPLSGEMSYPPTDINIQIDKFEDACIAYGTERELENQNLKLYLGCLNKERAKLYDLAKKLQNQ